jgi:hypothetical protein
MEAQAGTSSEEKRQINLGSVSLTPDTKIEGPSFGPSQFSTGQFARTEDGPGKGIRKG